MSNLVLYHKHKTALILVHRIAKQDALQQGKNSQSHTKLFEDSVQRPEPTCREMLYSTYHTHVIDEYNGSVHAEATRGDDRVMSEILSRQSFLMVSPLCESWVCGATTPCVGDSYQSMLDHSSSQRQISCTVCLGKSTLDICDVGSHCQTVMQVAEARAK